MKFGIIAHTNTTNLGDDFQSYAAAQFLSKVDYIIPREAMSAFESKDNEPVALIANAWYMWEKYNWPPAPCLIPCFVSMHYSIHEYNIRKGAPPAADEYLTGIGADYMNAYGPIGCRDYFTLDTMKKNDIACYLSGCLTLTIPKVEKVEVKKEYICLVNIDDRVVKRIKEELADTDIEVKVMTHSKERQPDLAWEEKEKNVREYLSIYQHAKCVVTGKLHCALPCMAVETPVLLLSHKRDSIRLSMYCDYLYNTSPEEYLSGKCDYDVANPPENKKDYLVLREGLIKVVTEFVEKMKDVEGPLEQFIKTTYTPLEFYKWQYEMDKKVMHEWHLNSLKKVKQIKKLQKEIDKRDNKYKNDKSFFERAWNKLKRIVKGE